MPEAVLQGRQLRTLADHREGQAPAEVLRAALAAAVAASGGLAPPREAAAAEQFVELLGASGFASVVPQVGRCSAQCSLRGGRVTVGFDVGQFKHTLHLISCRPLDRRSSWRSTLWTLAHPSWGRARRQGEHGARRVAASAYASVPSAGAGKRLSSHCSRASRDVHVGHERTTSRDECTSAPHLALRPQERRLLGGLPAASGAPRRGAGHAARPAAAGEHATSSALVLSRGRTVCGGCRGGRSRGRGGGGLVCCRRRS